MSVFEFFSFFSAKGRFDIGLYSKLKKSKACDLIVRKCMKANQVDQATMTTLKGKDIVSSAYRYRKPTVLQPRNWDVSTLTRKNALARTKETLCWSRRTHGDSRKAVASEPFEHFSNSKRRKNVSVN